MLAGCTGDNARWSVCSARQGGTSGTGARLDSRHFCLRSDVIHRTAGSRRSQQRYAVAGKLRARRNRTDYYGTLCRLWNMGRCHHCRPCRLCRTEPLFCKGKFSSKNACLPSDCHRWRRTGFEERPPPSDSGRKSCSHLFFAWTRTENLDYYGSKYGR